MQIAKEIYTSTTITEAKKKHVNDLIKSYISDVDEQMPEISHKPKLHLSHHVVGYSKNIYTYISCHYRPYFRYLL